ncbi:MAG: hypothetical protein ACRERE_30605 [Candidatus Entotheonellia bacterium]
MRTAKAIGLVFMILMGVLIALLLYSMSLNGRYAAMPIGDGKWNAPILIVDTRTGQVIVKGVVSAEAPPVSPKLKVATLVPWSE